jgi:hypothetical protein
MRPLMDTVKKVLFLENQFSWDLWVNQTTNLWIQWSIFLFSITQKTANDTMISIYVDAIILL